MKYSNCLVENLLLFEVWLGLVNVTTEFLLQHLHLLLYVSEGRALRQMVLLTLSSHLLCVHHLDGGVVEHLLPSVVELPLAAVVEEPLLGQADGLLGRRMDPSGSLELDGSLLTLGLGPGHLVQGLVVRPGLLYTVAELLGQTLQVVGGV